MITFNKITVFSIIYFLIVILTMFFVVKDDKTIQLYIKPLALITLGLLYIVSTKENNYFYLLILASAWFGEIFAIFHENYLVESIYCYIVFHLLIVVLVYKKLLKNKSIFDILTFGFPYLMVSLILLILIYEKLQNNFIPIMMIGMSIVVSGAIVLLNYSQKRTLSNYLIFVGLFCIVTGELAESIHIFGEQSIVFYYLLVILDFFGHYAMLRSILLKENAEKDIQFV